MVAPSVVVPPPPTSPVIKFYVPPSTRPKAQNYHIITFPDEPEPTTPWYKRNPDLIVELFLTALLFGTGAALVVTSFKHSNASVRQFLASIFFQAGLVPAVSAAFAIIRTRLQRGFQPEDIPTIIFLCASVACSRDPQGAWALYIGGFLFEAGLINMVLRAMFFVPAKEDEIRRLEKEVESLKTSFALGIADGYFSNFVKWVGLAVKRAGGTSPVTYRKPGGNNDEFLTEEMDVPCFFVAIPRRIQWDKETPMAWINQHYRSNDLTIDCHLGRPAAPDARFRPQWLSATRIPGGILLDAAPTTLQVVTDNIRLNTDKFKTDEQRTLQYLEEVNRFSERLAWLVKKEGLEDVVKIIEFENDIMCDLQTAYDEIISSTGNSGNNGSGGNNQGSGSGKSASGNPTSSLTVTTRASSTGSVQGSSSTTAGVNNQANRGGTTLSGHPVSSLDVDPTTAASSIGGDDSSGDNDSTSDIESGPSSSNRNS